MMDEYIERVGRGSQNESSRFPAKHGVGGPHLEVRPALQLQMKTPANSDFESAEKAGEICSAVPDWHAALPLHLKGASDSSPAGLSAAG